MKNKQISIVIGYLLALLLVSTSHANEYYVSTKNGNDNNPGTSARPWKTIQKAANVMRAGDTAIISGGTYRETVRVANSGVQGSPITFKAASGEKVVISGLQPISGWTRHRGNIFKANLNWSLGHEDQVFVVNNSSVKYLWEARWPNIASYTFPAMRNGLAIADGGSNSTLVDAALKQFPNDHWNGATLWFVGGTGGWLGQTSLISDSVRSTGKLTLRNPITNGQAPLKGADYYLSGVFDELDAENEWYIDAANNVIYLWAPGGGVPTNIEVKRRLEGFVLNNKSHIRIEGIELLAANIQMVNSNFNVIDGIKAQYIYGSDQSFDYIPPNQFEKGIHIVGNDNLVQNSDLSWTTGTMIQLQGNRNKVINNLIHHTSILAGYSPSIYFDEGSDQVVSHNTIHNTGRFAIYGSSTKPTEKLLIQNNHIYNYMWLSADGGAIYFWGSDMVNTEIRYNLIHDSKGLINNYPNNYHTEAHGIYLDSQSHNVLVHHNVIHNKDVVVYRNSSGKVFGDEALRFNKPGNYRLAYNNTFVDNPGGSFGIHSNKNYFGDAFGSKHFNNIMTDSVEAHPDIESKYNITKRSGLNMVNPANHNYRLKAGSSAVDAGVNLGSVNDGYVGDQPDIGAYEFGNDDWITGHNFANPPTPDFTRDRSIHMNLLMGGGFDSLRHWQSGASTKAVTATAKQEIPDGELERGLVNLLKLGNGAATSNHEIRQTVTGLKPNTKYRLSGWVFVKRGEQITFGVRNYGGAEVKRSARNTAYDQRRDIFFTTGLRSTEATVFIAKTSAGSGGYVYADDFGLVEIGPGENTPDKLTMISGPDRVTAGSRVNLSFDYEASEKRDVLLRLENADDSFKTAVNTRKTLNAGSGRVTESVVIDEDAAGGKNYQWQVVLVPVGENWEKKLDVIYQFGVTVNAAARNTAPVFNRATFSTGNATVGAAYTDSIADQASDADGDSLSFSIVSGPAWLSLSNNGTLSGTPTMASSRDSFQVKVVDGRGGEATASLRITVVNAPVPIINTPPVFRSPTISTADATVGLAYSASIASEASDVDGDILVYSLESGPAWLSVSRNGELSGTPSAAASPDTFQVKVVDGRGGEAMATLTIAVIETDTGGGPGSGGGNSDDDNPPGGGNSGDDDDNPPGGGNSDDNPPGGGTSDDDSSDDDSSGGSTGVFLLTSLFLLLIARRRLASPLAKQ